MSPHPSISTIEIRHAKRERRVQDSNEREQGTAQHGCNGSVGRDHRNCLAKGGVVRREHGTLEEVRKTGTRKVEARGPVQAEKE